jgi:hypothetical protein
MKYKMEDGTVIDTDRATQSWDEDTYWNGNNNCSVATGCQWSHQRLYRSRKGRYYVESWSNYQGSREHVEWVSNEGAVRWLLTNNRELPEELKHLEDEIVE